jgi:PAS domain S-box-containing protein
MHGRVLSSAVYRRGENIAEGVGALSAELTGATLSAILSRSQKEALSDHESITQTFWSKPQSPEVKDIYLQAETFLDLFIEGAALILPDKTVLGVNSRLAPFVGESREAACHEVLAGLPHVCPFCPFEDLVSTPGVAIIDQLHVRRGRKCSVSLRPIREGGTEGPILETIHDLDEAFGGGGNPPGNHGNQVPLLSKLSGLLHVSRELLAPGPFDERMVHVMKHVASSLTEPDQWTCWVELDDTVFGAPVDQPDGIELSYKIEVEGRSRGRLVAHSLHRSSMLPDDAYFLEEVANLIARQVVISDLEKMLRQSEERHRKLAANLAKEMWSRTEALAKETGYLGGILKCSDDMIVTTDLEGRIVEFNPAAESMLGYSAEEIQGRKIGDVWVDAEDRDRIMQEVRASGAIRNYQARLRSKEGDIREVSLTLSLLKDAEGRLLGTVGISKDVTRENAIRRELERLNQNYRETIHFISHETKNSLIVIGGFVRRLLEQETDPARKEQLGIVYHHSKFLEAMTRDYLIMAELEHGTLQVRKEPISNFYKEVILPAMIGLKERYPDSFESYDESMGGVGAISLLGDRSLLEIVYRNLFGNALKYRSAHGKIAYGVRDLGDRYEFNVWNAGPGVDSDQVDKIFDKFYRVANETTRDKRGTGLGLYNIRKIIAGHGGRIWCVSNPGHWINFIFQLPKA